MLRQVGQFGSHRRAIWWTCPGNPEKLLVSRLTLGKGALPPLGKTWKRKPNLWCFLDGCYSKDAGYCTFRQKSVFFEWSQNILELRTKIGGGVHFSVCVCVFPFDITFLHTSAPPTWNSWMFDRLSSFASGVVSRVEFWTHKHLANPSHPRNRGSTILLLWPLKKQQRDWGEKYVNIPSEKYIYVHIYVCICVYTYLCKMDERRSYASLS